MKNVILASLVALAVIGAQATVLPFEDAPMGRPNQTYTDYVQQATGKVDKSNFRQPRKLNQRANRGGVQSRGNGRDYNGPAQPSQWGDLGQKSPFAS